MGLIELSWIVALILCTALFGTYFRGIVGQAFGEGLGLFPHVAVARLAAAAGARRQDPEGG